MVVWPGDRKRGRAAVPSSRRRLQARLVARFSPASRAVTVTIKATTKAGSVRRAFALGRRTGSRGNITR
jgi:hypothetical protein